MQTLGIIDNIFRLFDNVSNGFAQVYNFFVGLFNLIRITIEFIPQPFYTITLIFIPILIASILYKIIRG